MEREVLCPLYRVWAFSHTSTTVDRIEETIVLLHIPINDEVWYVRCENPGHQPPYPAPRILHSVDNRPHYQLNSEQRYLFIDTNVLIDKH